MIRFRKVEDPRKDRSIWDGGWRFVVVVSSAVILDIYLGLYLVILLRMVGL